MSAPKHLAKRRNLERKKQRKQQARLRRLRKREVGPYFEEGVLYGGPSGVKMSEVLAQFVEPFAGWVDGEEDYRKLLTLGAAAWNAALESEAFRQAMLDDALATQVAGATDEDRNAFTKLFSDLVTRKHEQFAAYRRPILDFILEDTGRGYQLVVISSLDE
jgi:hypothetical protein